MTYADDSFDTLPRMPSWVTSVRAETSEDVAFLSGAALAHLHLVLAQPNVPQDLLRARLALRAAEACVIHSGRPERAADLRDAVGFLQPGDGPGPAGEVYQSWQRAVERPVSVKALHRALPHLTPEQIAVWLDGCDPREAGQAAPIPRAVSVLEAVTKERSRDYGTALILADTALAQALGWSQMLPFLSLGLKRADLRLDGDELSTAAHRAVVKAASRVVRETAELERRTQRLKAAAPRLRAKGADEAVALFLKSDVIAPMNLSSFGSQRAARRFCDRLVELGVARELTGRDTFRLYGV